MIHESTIDGERVLSRLITVVAVENPSVGDWAAYVADRDDWARSKGYTEDTETFDEYAKRQGDKLSEAEAYRYFSGPQCPRGPYRG